MKYLRAYLGDYTWRQVVVGLSQCAVIANRRIYLSPNLEIEVPAEVHGDKETRSWFKEHLYGWHIIELHNIFVGSARENAAILANFPLPVIPPRDTIPENYRLDYAHASHLPFWSIEEAACFSMGIKCIFETDAYTEQTYIDALTSNIRDRIELLSRFQNKKEPPMSPNKWCHFMDEEEIPMPFILRAKVAIIEQKRRLLAKREGKRAGSLDEHISNEGVSKREFESALKLIAGMAIAQYGFDPRDARSGVVKNIAEDLSDIGLNIHEDTIRKHLRKACDLVPQAELMNYLNNADDERTS